MGVGSWGTRGFDSTGKWGFIVEKRRVASPTIAADVVIMMRACSSSILAGSPYRAFTFFGIVDRVVIVGKFHTFLPNNTVMTILSGLGTMMIKLAQGGGRARRARVKAVWSC